MEADLTEQRKKECDRQESVLSEGQLAAEERERSKDVGEQKLGQCAL